MYEPLSLHKLSAFKLRQGLLDPKAGELGPEKAVTHVLLYCGSILFHMGCGTMMATGTILQKSCCFVHTKFKDGDGVLHGREDKELRSC